MDDILLTVDEVSTKLKTSKVRVYSLIKAGLLPAMNLGGLKIRRIALCKFLENYEGYDLTDVGNVVKMEVS